MAWIDDKLGDWADGFHMLRKSLRFLFQHPSTLLPLVVIWLASAHIIFYVLPRIPWKFLDTAELFGLIYLLNSLLCLLQLLGCSVLLELLQHIETGRPMRLFAAVRDTLFRNIVAIIPLALLWSLIQVILWILEALLARKNSNSTSETAIEAFFDMIQTALRMAAFLVLPAVAWEKSNALSAVRRSIRIIRKEFATFLGAMSFSMMFMGLVGLPLALLARLNPDWIEAHWEIVLVYCMALWTLKTYLEQMMMAELYLWVRSRDWKEFAAATDTMGRRSYETEIMPSLFNGVPDLSERLRIR